MTNNVENFCKENFQGYYTSVKLFLLTQEVATGADLLNKLFCSWKNFAIFTGKHLCWSLFLIKLQALWPAALLKSDSNTCSVFLWILQKQGRPFFKNTDFEEHLQTTAFVAPFCLASSITTNALKLLRVGAETHKWCLLVQSQ